VKLLKPLDPHRELPIGATTNPPGFHTSKAKHPNDEYCHAQQEDLRDA
jgi:hypothetical protein